ncbi:tetratricopeptide repeat protein [Sulfurimonas sp.]|uniref:tetratricopeptide repeat protein n=1 Tax=Sulfurimonas sp. TaxID=2022749 RepID=UPI003D109178
MYRSFLFIFLSMFFIACSTKQEVVSTSNKKVFEAEDTYIMYALRAEQVQSYKTAAELFAQLYDKSQKKEYFYRSLQDSYLAKDFEQVISTVDRYTQEPLQDRKLARLKIASLAESGKTEEAKTLSIALAKETKEPEDYVLTADIYIKKHQYDEALQYLESVYAKNHNEKILDKISIILYVNLSRKKDAIAELETYTRVHGCTKVICERLIGIYSNENDIDGLLSVYKRKYAQAKESEIAKKIIQIYGYRRDYVHLMNFLEESNEDDELLLQLYLSAKDFKKASVLADTFYKQEGVIDYLGQSAIYEYEAHKEKLDKKILNDVVTKLEKVVAENSDTLYKNYLGYILIDHNLNVKKGMKYIKEVLKVKPDSGYYLDSLAWGYYKLGQCKTAKKLMLKVKTLEGGDDPEVQSHIDQINKCLKIQRGKSSK